MPFGSEGVEAGIGLALSGGGFRATLFHCGALWRLNELGYLPKLSRISSVSGGSITAGWLACKWTTLHFSNGVANNFVKEVTNPLRKFCGRSVDTPSILKGVLWPGKRVSDAVEGKYRKYLFGETTLQDLPTNNAPLFVFNSTNLATGVDFRFSKPYAGDYRIGLIKNPDFRVSLAVAASSAYPPYLSPVVIDANPVNFTRTKGADLFDEEAYRKRLVLSDGGVYDNLGLETVWNRYQTLLVSDAGLPFDLNPGPRTNWYGQTLRAFDVTANQARALRKRALAYEYQFGYRNGSYWGIMTEFKGYNLPGGLLIPAEVIKELAKTRTRLNSFSEEEQCRLINWGYAVCDIRMRRYLVKESAPLPKWPYPNFALG
ncbi:MAG TPA: patatin-like phospholipase family protein [Nitrospiria bacterium]|nr:patatin-like phospholipase family protein [Nitrospiria bacterium]